MSQLEFYKNLPQKELEIRLVVGIKEAVAYAWIKAYAEQLSRSYDDNDDRGGDVTMDDLIEAALSFQNGKWGNYICRGGRFEGMRTDPLFWFHLRILLENPDLEEASFFTCSC